MKKYLLLFLFIISAPLSADVKVLAFAGSTREDSLNKKLVLEAAQMARDLDANVTVIDLKDFPLPLYDADYEKKEGMPNNAKRLRKLMIESQAIIIATPEYNGSIPALLKNVLDWTSRSENGQSSRDAFKGKKFAIMSASPGGGGGIRGLIHLRSIIDAIGGDVVAQQVAVSTAHNAFSKKGNLENEEVKKELKEEIQQLLKNSQK